MWFALWVAGLIGFFAVMILSLQHQAAKKQSELNAQEFQKWFEKNYMGMSHHSGAP